MYIPYTQGPKLTPKLTVYSISNNFVHESEISRCRILQLGHEVRALRVPVFEARQMLVGISDGALYLRTRSYYGTQGTEPFPCRVGFVTAFYGGASLPEGHEDPSLLVCVDSGEGDKQEPGLWGDGDRLALASVSTDACTLLQER